MMNTLIEDVVNWAMHVAGTYGYAGIFATMALESAAIPIPSEVVVPFGGFLASTGQLSLVGVVIAATLANCLGAIVTYAIGRRWGDAFLRRFGRYLLIHRPDIEKLHRWTGRYGSATAFFSRLLPGVRTFSSLIIGTAEMPFGKFFLYTLLGSFLWNLPLAYAGYAAGEHWDFLQPYFHRFQTVILVLIVIAIVIFIFRQIHKIKGLRTHPQ
jgi:membrane protein DedA with SNARE-associated domain